MKETLQKAIQKVIEEFAKTKGFLLPDGFQVELELSKDPEHGDLTTPVAFRLAKCAQEKPSAIAEEIVRRLEAGLQKDPSNPKLVSRAEVAGHGFINFFVAAAPLAGVLLEIHEKDQRFGESSFGRGEKVLIEFVSANPTGPLTIAHGRQAAVGDSLARILKITGHEVTREYYLNDSGRQMNLLGESVWARYQSLQGIETKVPDEGYQGAYLIEIAEGLKKKNGDSLLKKDPKEAMRLAGEFAASEILKGIREDLEKIDVRFDSYFSEKSLAEAEKVEKVIGLLRKKGLVYEEAGALWFRSTKFGDDKDRVLRKQTGEYTYLAPDAAYHGTKFERGFSKLVNLWGPDHHGYIPRLKAACQGLGYSPDRVLIRIIQLSTLFRKGEPVRMSTRAGEFVTLRELVKEVGPDATRFFFLLRRIESHLDFDLDLAKTESEENPVYYLQYAHARISSILKFAQRKIRPQISLERLGEPGERDLIKRLSEFPEVLIQSAQALEPYRVVEYLRELAGQFHKFYAVCRVVTEDEALTNARLLLVDGVRIVLRNGLEALGISHPETM